MTLTASNTVKVHLRPGSIIVKQENPDKKFNSTSDVLSQIPHTLIANRDVNKAAYGTLFLDSGDSRQEIANGTYEYIQFQLQEKSIIRMNGAGTEGSRNGMFYKFTITDAADLQDTTFACILGNDMSVTNLDISPLSSTTTTITFSSKTSVKFSDIKQIVYGNDADINLCS